MATGRTFWGDPNVFLKYFNFNSTNMATDRTFWGDPNIFLKYFNFNIINMATDRIFWGNPNINNVLISLFDDAYLHCRSLNGKMIVNNESHGMWNQT